MGTITMWAVGTAVALVEDRDCMGTVTGYVKTRDDWRVVVDLDEPAKWVSVRPSGDRSGPSVFATVALALDAVERLDAQVSDDSMPTARLLRNGQILCGHAGCDASAHVMAEHGYTRTWQLEVETFDAGQKPHSMREIEDREDHYFEIVANDQGDNPDDGDGHYYLTCDAGHHNERPFDTWNWN